jgi:tetratricopeptide (TPR) repeat protein
MTGELEVSYDPHTLREVYADPAAVHANIEELREEVRTAPDVIDELRARGDLVELLRGVGELDEALAEGQRAVDRADIAGTAPQQHLARVRLAHVHQWRGEFVESNIAFTELLNAADQFGPIIEAYTHEHAGKNSFDQQHYADAHRHFTRALAIRRDFELPDEEIAPLQLAVDVANNRLEEQT